MKCKCLRSVTNDYAEQIPEADTSKSKDVGKQPLNNPRNTKYL